MWGVFETDESIHVIPCDNKGFIKQPHEVDDLCSCDPDLEQEENADRYVMIHHEAN
jgi:hypothetical protein